MNDKNENVNTIEYNANYNMNIKQKSTGLGLASMLIGILGIFFCCCLSMFANIWIMCCVLGFFIAGLMMGIVAVSKDKRNGMTNGMGITGIILCIMQAFVVIIYIFSLLYTVIM